MGLGFVGRAEELAAIEELLAETRRSRRASALLVVAEPGMGKSRLLSEAELQHHDGPILRFAGYEPESTVPLTAAAPLLRRIAAASEDGSFHEVARFVAGGATNAEIATRLFLSPKTVEHHVSNALSKLGLHSRTELAARVGEASRDSDREDGATPP